jgi:hypothetical protein
MADYLLASATRRKSIIRAARFPSTSVVAQYDKAREGLIDFVCDLNRSIKHLAKATDYLDRRDARPDASEWIRRDNRLSKEAIDTFQRLYNKLKLAPLDCRPVPGRQPALDIWPTRISVHLDATTHRHVANGRDRIGGLIFLFSRGETSPAKRATKCKTIAGLAHTFCTRFLANQGNPDLSLCLAVDVFGGVSHNPPGTFARQLSQIADACDEIAGRWRSIEPPADYDGPDPD